MRKLVVALLFIAMPLFGADKWWDSYNRGVAAVNAKNYRAGAEALQRAVSEMPSEGTAVRAGNTIMTYVPHFYLGIAKFNLGDVDGALREWKTCEEQGAIARTDYYARMKDWVARAQTEKQREAQSEASGPKKAADAAIGKALALQVDALSAGADRTESYRNAVRKLQAAMSQFRGAGTDVGAFKSAEQTAQQSSALFAAAVDDAKKQKAAKPVAPPQQKKPAVIDIVVPVEEPKPAPPPVPTTTVAPQPQSQQHAAPQQQQPQVESEAKVSATLAVQQYRRNAAAAPQPIARAEVREVEAVRKQLADAKTDADFNRVARAAVDHDLALARKIAETPAIPAAPPTLTATVAIAPNDLSEAYRAFAGGDLAGAERMLTQTLAARPAPEAFLLRGCIRYTRAMLSRTPDPLLAAATNDFRAALDRNRALRLDRSAFSPKLVAFFEQVRGGR